jgi:hypothetical protein
MTRSRTHAGRECRFISRLNAISSIRGSRGNPAKASRRTKIAWSPVAMPVSRERRFIAPATTASSGWRASIRTSKRPQVERSSASCTRTIGVRRQSCIGVQENERRALRSLRARVHLHGAAALASQHAVAERPREVGRAVAAAAVDEDHFVAARAQRRQRLERGADPRRLVQRRDDDGESFSAQS